MDILSKVYPALYQYLLPYRFGNALLDQYFQDYKYQKVMFGDLDKIDILAETKTGEVVMVLVCNGFIDGSPETQKALLDKMEGYLNHTQSEEFQKEYGGWPVILRVTFGREPDEHILALLSKCPAWAADYGVKLEFEIGGKQVRIVES